ncbi:DUF2059 domain-containing protein [Longimicrobium sp.]|uniref:DUF2059 domain-containing protein n=1 Tax=Longimicrobium sp. TaxID=2029185 RepID=UPI002BF69B0B|nr:DUF2059 domain-containing protein [Longimicrobium sp.]HSU14806.1 DUF2059 domain-containing protein [Longimicrobium sp.]
MKTRMALAAVALLALARPAHAQDPSPARMRAAAEVLEAGQLQRGYERTLDLMIEQQKQTNPAIAQYEQQMRDFFRKYISWAQIEPEFVRLYAETYTEDELRQLAAFYRTPLGRRLMETQPELAARSSEVTQRLLREHLPELMQTVMEAEQQSRSRATPGGTPKKP